MIENLHKTIYRYYPKGLSVDDVAWDESTEIQRQRDILNSIIKQTQFWEDFKKRLRLILPELVDLSAIPSVNSCFFIQSPLLTQGISLYISALYPGFCYNIWNRKTGNFIGWNIIMSDEMATIIESVEELITIYFPNYILVPLDLLKLKVQEVSTSPFSQLGEGKVFNYLFTYHPIEDEWLF